MKSSQIQSAKTELTENQFHTQKVGRITRTFFVVTAWVLATYPYGDSFYPEGNWLPGPLWFFKIQAWGEKAIGLIATILCLSAITSFFAWPSPRTLWVTIMGVVLWIGIGLWLAILAAI